MGLGRSVTYRDLRFTKVPVACAGSRGSPYLRWMDTGMPVLPPAFLNCVFFLYKDRQSAEAGENAGGTGFLIATPTSDGLGHHYGVTNHHVAVRGGFSCIRINTADGKTETFEFGPEDWIFNADGDDVAIIPLDIRSPLHVAFFIGANLLLFPEALAKEAVGPGDDVFMVGRFVDLDESHKNHASLRFGNISASPVPIKQPNGHIGECFTIDMHSRTGYSGSPVLVYRTPGNSLEWTVTGGPVTLGGGLLALLGVHCGQFPESLPIKKRRGGGRKIAYGDMVKEEYVEGLSGMTIVIPAWRILELLARDELVQQRKKVEAMRAKDTKSRTPEATSEVAGQAERRFEDTLKAMLATPPQPKSAKRTRAKKAK